MEGWVNWLIPAVLVVVVLVVQIGRHFYERRRSDVLKEASLKLGLNFMEDDPAFFYEDFSDLPLFSRGYSRRARNVMRSGDGLMFFDYSFTESGGKSSRTYNQTIAAVEFDADALPTFTMTPEGVFRRLASMAGVLDVDFDSHPDFSSAYHLTGSDEAAIRKFFTQRVLDFFGAEEGWSMEGGDGWLVIYRAAKRVVPAELSSFIGDIRRMKEALERG